MVYTAEEKKRIDNVLETFGDYIRQHKEFDIVYSDKSGYFRIWVKDMTVEAPYPIDSVETLLDELFLQISSDVRELNMVGYHDDIDLFPEEIIETRRRVEPVLNAMTSDREYCLERLDYYLEHVND